MLYQHYKQEFWALWRKAPGFGGLLQRLKEWNHAIVNAAFRTLKVRPWPASGSSHSVKGPCQQAAALRSSSSQAVLTAMHLKWTLAEPDVADLRLSLTPVSARDGLRGAIA